MATLVGVLYPLKQVFQSVFVRPLKFGQRNGPFYRCTHMWIFLHKVNTTTANNNNKGFSLNTKPIKTQQNEKRRNIY